MISDNYAAGDKPRVQSPDGVEPDSSGMVLVVVVILAAVAGVLAAGLHFASGARLTQVRQEIRFEKAFFVAEAGIERAKAELLVRATNLNGVLIGNDGVADTADDGVLSFGCPTNYGEGRFCVKVRNNNSENPFVDTDHIVVICSTGIVETAARVIEVELTVMPTLAFTSMPTRADGALGIYGTNSSLNVDGKILDGHDYNVPSNFICSGAEGNVKVPTTNPAVAGVYAATNATIDPDNIDGHPPIINGVSTNMSSEIYWLQLLNALLPSAITYNNDGIMGARTNPVVIVVAGNTSIAGTVDGAGVLIIPGDATLRVSGTFHYEGLIILMGGGAIDFDADLAVNGTVDIYGAIICVGDNLDVNTKGSSRIKYSSQALANLANTINLPPQLPAHIDNTGSWREIKVASTNW